MGKNILVIGGTRFFGRLLVQRLLSRGHTVTIATRGKAADHFGDRVGRITVDRRNERAMRAAFAGVAHYDVVYDQMCYSPLDAAIAVNTFAGKVGRYIMASTIEVYRDLIGQIESPYAESDIRVERIAIDTASPWHDPAFADANYARGKRQAEAFIYRDGRLPAVSVRIGHVLGGPDDFTGRLAGYVDLARQNLPLRYTNAAASSSFLNPQEIADFMLWAGTQEFLGPVNAACDGPLSAFDLFHRVGAVLDVPVTALPSDLAARGVELSPFDYAGPFALDTRRARELGFQFSHADEWIEDLIRLHDLAFV